MKKKIKGIIFIIILAAIIAGIVTTLITMRKKKSERTVNIVFYGLSEEYENLIKKNIPELENVIFNYITIADGKFDSGIVASKYDMLFTWKGEYTDILSNSAEDIPGKILENIPVSLRNKKYLPILLDHYEMNFNLDVQNKTDTIPEISFDNFMEYLNEAKAYVFVPFFMAGAKDRDLLAFVGSIIEAKGGLDAYNKFLDLLKRGENLDSILEEDLGNDVNIKKILDMLQNWSVEGITHPMWYMGTDTDVTIFSEDNQVGSLFTSLINHREMNYNLISKFETSLFPRADDSIKHGVIAPAICGMLLSDNSNGKKILKDLMTDDVQSAMSNATKLAPVHYKAETYDRQADDVRFWAAACAGGAIPDPALAVYQKNPNSLGEMAKEIRTYLKIRKS